MSFNALVNAGARQQMLLLGAVPCVFHGQAANAINTFVVIDRDVEVVTDNGLAMEKRTVCSLWKQDVGRVVRGHTITVGTESFTVNDLLSDDGFVIEVYVRG